MDLLLINKLLLLEERILSYYIESVEFLSIELPILSGRKIGIFPNSINFPDVSQFVPKQQLVSKFINKIEQLDRFEEAFSVYNRLTNFLKDDLTSLCNSIDDIEGKLDSNSVEYQFFRLFFPKDLFQNYINTILNADWLPECESSSNEVLNDKLNDLPDIDEFPLSNNVNLSKTIIANYTKIYSLEDPIEFNCFKLSIAKEISFDPHLKEDYEMNYENLILRSILDNEMNNSPSSFNEEECKVLDYMEVLTFYLDSLPKSLSLIDNSLLTTLNKLQYFGYSKDDTDIVHLTKLKNTFKNFENKINEFTKSLIKQGTVGLSHESNSRALLALIEEFQKISKTLIIIHRQILIKFNNKFSSKIEIFKEENHLIEVLNLYINNLIKLSTFINSNSILDIIDHKKQEFENLDSVIKDHFFQLIYFNQRIQFEMDIINELNQSNVSS